MENQPVSKPVKTKKLSAAGQKKRLDLKSKFAASYIVKPNAYKAGINAGMPKTTAKAASYDLLNDETVQKLLQEYREDFVKGCKADFQWKANKLIKCIEKAIPDDFEHKDHKLMSVAIKAISELNKMQGDYAPVKTINVNFTPEMKQEVRELLIKYDKPY